jgi:chromosome partitioning related protein ParA
MPILTICATKGGVGKTTVTANLGGFLADHGNRVLIIDADVQPTLSSYFPLGDPVAERGLTDLIQSATADGAISRTGIRNLDLIYSDDPEGELQHWIARTPDGRFRIRRALEELGDRYDYILIDTQGAVGGLQDAAILAADLLVSPITPEMLSAREFLRGTVQMLERLGDLRYLGFERPPLVGVLNRMDQTRDARDIANQIRDLSSDHPDLDIRIADTVIPATVAYRKAASLQTPVHRIEHRRSGPTLPALETMRRLAIELGCSLPSDPDYAQVKEN